MMALIWLAALCFGIFVLVKASDIFLDSGEKIGLAFKIPAPIIGATIIAFGTSLPELLTSSVATMRGNSEIALANVIGSNIANVLFILGLSAVLFKGIDLDFKKIKPDLAFYSLGTIILFLFMKDFKIVTYEAVILCVLMIFITIFYTKLAQKNETEKTKDAKATFKTYFLLLFSCFLLYISSEITVKSIVEISTILNISKTFIAITVLALGTSLPELAVSLSALKLRKTDILLGNIIGSNVFNIFCVLGVSGLFGELIVDSSTKSAFWYMGATLILIFACLHKKKIALPMGLAFLVLYGMFIVSSF